MFVFAPECFLCWREERESTMAVRLIMTISDFFSAMFFFLFFRGRGEKIVYKPDVKGFLDLWLRTRKFLLSRQS